MHNLPIGQGNATIQNIYRNKKRTARNKMAKWRKKKFSLFFSFRLGVDVGGNRGIIVVVLL